MDPQPPDLALLGCPTAPPRPTTSFPECPNADGLGRREGRGAGGTWELRGYAIAGCRPHAPPAHATPHGAHPGDRAWRRHATGRRRRGCCCRCCYTRWCSRATPPNCSCSCSPSPSLTALACAPQLEAREERQNAQIAKMMWVLLALLGGSAAASQHTAPPSVRVLSSEPPYHLPPPHGGGLSLEATRAYGALALWWSACAHRTAPLPHGWLIEQIKWLMRPLTH